MDVQQMIEKLTEARGIIREVQQHTDVPQIARCAYLADMNLHLALWNLGEIDEIMPELE